MPRPPFDLLRAAFLLLAAAMGVAMLVILAAESGCIWLIVVEQSQPIGACRDIGDQLRELWSEMITAILALLLAGRNAPPPPPDKGQDG